MIFKEHNKDEVTGKTKELHMTILVLLMLNLLIAKSQKQCAEIVPCLCKENQDEDFRKQY